MPTSSFGNSANLSPNGMQSGIATTNETLGMLQTTGVMVIGIVGVLLAIMFGVSVLSGQPKWGLGLALVVAGILGTSLGVM